MPSLLEPKWTVAFEMDFLNLWTCRRFREASVVSMQVVLHRPHPRSLSLGHAAAFENGTDITNVPSYLVTEIRDEARTVFVVLLSIKNAFCLPLL